MNGPGNLSDPAHISRLLVIEIYRVPGNQLSLHEIVPGLLAWLPSRHVLSAQTMELASVSVGVRKGATKPKHNSEEKLSSP